LLQHLTCRLHDERRDPVGVRVGGRTPVLQVPLGDNAHTSGDPDGGGPIGDRKRKIIHCTRVFLSAQSLLVAAAIHCDGFLHAFSEGAAHFLDDGQTAIATGLSGGEVDVHATWHLDVRVPALEGDGAPVSVGALVQGVPGRDHVVASVQALARPDLELSLGPSALAVHPADLDPR